MKRANDFGMWISLAAFVMVSALAGAGWTYRMDFALIRAAQGWASGALDIAGEFFSETGDWEVMGLALLVIAAAIYYRGRRRTAARVLLAFLATAFVELVLKMTLPVPPIPEYLGRSDGFAPLVAVDFPYPYPSGHLLRSVIVFGALYLWTRSRPLGVIAALYVTGAALTRIYMGVHWPSDVVGGILLGLAGLLWAFKSGKG